MGKLNKCPNGHFYDPDMYKECPYCEGLYTIPLKEKEPQDLPIVLYGPVLPRPKAEQAQRATVGCLVAVSGPHCGESFALYERYNYIGRESGDIVLAKDRCVSRVKNAWIMYSYTRNRFKIGAGESVNIVYVNQEELTADSSVVLEPYDLIEIGQSKLRFIPFEDKAL